MLRGFYLTSGVQEGEALDRILASMAQVYEQPVEAPAPGRGRAYFLNRLLTEVMFPEAGSSPPMRRPRGGVGPR